MIPYMKVYIQTGDCFADEIVYCMRCGEQIVCLGYKELPSNTDPSKKVQVAHRKQLNNYCQMPVLLLRKGRESITSLQLCQGCMKEVDPGRDSDQLVKQIRRALAVEARYIAMPEEAIEAINKAWADAQILRKLTPQEVAEGRILQEVS